MSKCSKKCNEIKQKIDNISGLDDETVYDWLKRLDNVTEAIEYLKESVLIYKNTIPKMSNTIDTVLSLIKAQQEEISKYKTLYERALSDVVKTDKQIDLMAELVYKRFKAELLLEYGFENEEQLKQYFAGLVEKEGENNA